MCVRERERGREGEREKERKNKATPFECVLPDSRYTRTRLRARARTHARTHTHLYSVQEGRRGVCVHKLRGGTVFVIKPKKCQLDSCKKAAHTRTHGGSRNALEPSEWVGEWVSEWVSEWLSG